MYKAFKQKSIVVLNIKYGVKKSSIKTIFKRFGEIEAIKTYEAKNKTIMAFIRYENVDSVTKALNYSPIICCGIPLSIREAYKEIDRPNKCNCIVCDKELITEYKKVQKSLFEAIISFHNAPTNSNDRKAMKDVKKELRAVNKRLYKRVKKAIGS